MSLVVSALNVYPIKGCAGLSLDAAPVGPRGLLHDRELMLVDAATGMFLTQRELPRLALIRPLPHPGDPLGPPGEATLVLEAPAMPRLEVQVVRDGPRREVVVWDDRCRAVDQGDEAAGWLSEFVGRGCRLVRMADEFVRKVDPRYARSERDQVGFADGYPFLLISEESLADLNARLATPLPMNRFRPSLVIRGEEPFVEDRLGGFRIGAITFHAVKPCARCVVTTTDQTTAAVGKEPLATLATFRQVGHKVLFGQNLVHEGTGTIRVGDRLVSI